MFRLCIGSAGAGTSSDYTAAQAINKLETNPIRQHAESMRKTSGLPIGFLAFAL